MEKEKYFPSSQQETKTKFNFKDLKNNFINFNKITQEYECKICNYCVSGIKKAYEHISDLTHIDLLKQKQIEIMKIERENARKNIPSYKNYALFTYEKFFQNFIIQIEDDWKCCFCEFLIPDNHPRSVLQHIYKDQNHQLLFRRRRKTMNVLTEDVYKRFIQNGIIENSLYKYYYCYCCKLRLKNLDTIHNHIITKSHILNLSKPSNLTNENNHFFDQPKIILQLKQNKKKNLSKNFQTVQENRPKNFQAAQENRPKKFQAVQENRPKKFQTVQQQKKTFKEKFPSHQELANLSSKYISKCLEIGEENIYNIDYEKLRLMQLGNSLVFTYKNDYICVLCNYKFPKNFQVLIEHLQHEVHINNLCDVEESSLEQKQHPNEFNDLEIIQSCMIEESDEIIKCLMCDVEVNNFDDEIRTHINSENHVSSIKIWKEETELRNETLTMIMKNSWYYVDKYFCQICDENFYREICFVKHLEEPDHINKEKNSDSKSKINICYACFSCWYGKADYCLHYANDEVHNKMKKIDYISLPIKQTTTKLLIYTNQNIYNFIRESNKVVSQKDKEENLINTIVNTVKPIYPNCKAYIFGSRNSFLSLTGTSDVDIFLDCEDKYKDVGSKEESNKYITAIKKQFSSNRKDWKRILILSQPRVPLIKTEHVMTSLKCDISFLSGLGVEKTHLIRNHVLAYQACREMILFLKKWLRTCELYGATGINAYGISWCVIFFLQVKGIFPSVYELIKLKNLSNIVDGWECGFPETIPVTDSNCRSWKLLKEFFLYYANFDYCNSIICPLIGKVIKKKTFSSINEFPEEMDVYKHRLATEEMEWFRYDSPMCVQDPVDLSQNITKAVKKKQLICFKNFCEKSHITLELYKDVLNKYDFKK